MDVILNIPLEVLICIFTGITVVLTVVGIIRSKPVFKDIFRKVLQDTIDESIKDDKALRQVITTFIKYVELKYRDLAESLKDKVRFFKLLNMKLLVRKFKYRLTKVVIHSKRNKKDTKNPNNNNKH